MYNPVVRRIVQTCNVIWMGRMFHTRRDADLMQQLPIVTVPISTHNKSVDTEIQRLEIAMFPLSEERGYKAILHQRKQMNGFKQKCDMATQSDKKMVNTIQAQELLSSGVIWRQLKLMTSLRIRWQITKIDENKSRFYRCSMTVSLNISTLELVWVLSEGIATQDRVSLRNLF
jgi:hypothetical protein